MMALRDQPYLPLYIQDFLTDEKLIECSAAATGIYIRIMCILHKSEHYGKFLLRQKDRQSDRQIKNFAEKLVKHLPYTVDVIFAGLTELIEEGCLHIEGDFLVQKRMVRDNDISLIRSKSGAKGAEVTNTKNKNFAAAKKPANSEYEYENENINENVFKGGVGENPENLCFDFEQYLLAHQKELETVCINAKKSVDEVKEMLTSYHLWNVQNEKYPKRPLPLIAGFQRWVLNQNKFYKNGSHTKQAEGTGRSLRRDKL